MSQIESQAKALEALAEKATTPESLLRSSLRRYDFAFAHDMGGKPWPFNYRLAVEQCQSWVYRCVMGNAERAASIPLRLYVRNMTAAQIRARGLKRGCLFQTRPVSRKQMAYLRGDSDHKPSLHVSRKIAQFGDEFEEVVESHPVLDVLNQSNPWMSGFSLATFRFMMLQLTGNAYLHPIMDEGLGRPSELWPMLSQYTWIQPDPVDYLRGYLYGVERDRLIELAPEEVIHFRKPNATDLYYGKGPVEAAWSALGLQNSKRESDKALFDNRARPDYLLTVKDASEPALERFEEKVKQLHRGVRMAGGFMAITGDVSAQPLNFPPDKMGDHQEVIEEVAAVLGYPITKLKGNDPNRANAEQGDRGWLADTIAPMLREDEQALNEAGGYLGLFGDGALLEDAVLCYDNPVPSDREFELKERESNIRSGMVSINEERIADGRDEVEGGDEPMVDGGRIPLRMAGMAQMMQAMPTQQPQPTQPEQPDDTEEATEVVAPAREFNGAQVTAAVDVLMGVTDRTIAPDAAVTLLVTMFGMGEPQARSMVEAQVAARPSGTTVANGANDADGTGQEVDPGVQQEGAESGSGDASPEQRSHQRSSGAGKAGTSDQGSRDAADSGPADHGQRGGHDASGNGVKAVSDVDLTPPKGVQKAAQQGLDYRDEYGRGGTDVGIARARDLSNGKSVSPETIGRMVSFFARHEDNRDPDAREPDGGPTNGWIAWLLWGGDAGRSWSNRKQDELANAAEKSHVSVLFSGEGCTCHHDDEPTTAVGKYLARSKADADDDIRDDPEAPEIVMALALADEFSRQVTELRRAINAATLESIDNLEDVIGDADMLDEWDGRIANAVRPTLSEAMTAGGSQGMQSVGVEVGFDVTNPKVSEFLEEYRFRLAGAVNQTTLDALSQQVRIGVEQGENVREITSRILDASVGTEANPGPVFSQQRSRVIARTETARAYVEGERLAWEQSGVVEGKQWLLAPDACEFCRAAAKAFEDRTLGLSETFYKRGDTLTGEDGGVMRLDYSDIQGPPLHPNDRCDLRPITFEVPDE